MDKFENQWTKWMQIKGKLFASGFDKLRQDKIIAEEHTNGKIKTLFAAMSNKNDGWINKPKMIHEQKLYVKWSISRKH